MLLLHFHYYIAFISSLAYLHVFTCLSSWSHLFKDLRRAGGQKFSSYKKVNWRILFIFYKHDLCAWAIHPIYFFLFFLRCFSMYIYSWKIRETFTSFRTSSPHHNYKRLHRQPTNGILWASVCLALLDNLRRWANHKPASAEHILVAGCTSALRVFHQPADDVWSHKTSMLTLIWWHSIDAWLLSSSVFTVIDVNWAKQCR